MPDGVKTDTIQLSVFYNIRVLSWIVPVHEGFNTISIASTNSGAGLVQLAYLEGSSIIELTYQSLSFDFRYSSHI